MSARCGELLVYDSPIQLAAAVADAFVAGARGSIAERGEFFVALAGGTTPKAAYELLAAIPRRAEVDWTRVTVFFSDERCVGPESDESNYKMAAESFLRSAGIPPENIHRMHGEEDPRSAAAAYAQLLIRTMGASPRFDLIMLGMGADGHTASLFPGSDPRDAESLLVRPVYVEKLGTHRLTFTPRLINAARHVIVAVEGLPKAPALYAVREGPFDPSTHPIQIVAPADGRLSWYVDRAAAAELPAT